MSVFDYISGTQIIWTVVIVLFVFIFVKIVFGRKPFLLELTEDELDQTIKNDIDTLKYLHHRIDTLIHAIEVRGYFTQEAEYTKEVKREMRSLWGELISVFLEIDLLKYRYRGFYKISFTGNRDLHARTFILGYTAFLSQYSHVLHLEGLAITADAKTILNEENREFGIPKNSYIHLTSQVARATEILQLSIGSGYLKLLRNHIDEKLIGYIDYHLDIVRDSISTYPKLFVLHPLRYLRRHTFTLWYPVVKRIALGLSYIRGTDRDYFISNERIQKEKSRLQIGDIFLTKRNWHATNLGVPGYWSHSVLYIGTLNEMDAYFKDVMEKKPSEIIKEKFPDAYEQLNKRDDRGYKYSAIESKRPGVVFSSLAEATQADSLAVLRPRNVTKEEQFEVVLSALEELGKPYDYQFDFKTDNALVCSELVYKAYECVPSLTITPTEQSGHLLFAPNQFAEKFDRELDTPDQQLDLVMYLEGNDKKHDVTERDVEVFKDTWRRPKWHIVTEYIAEH